MRATVTVLRTGWVAMSLAIAIATARGDEPRGSAFVPAAESGPVERLPAVRPVVTPAIAPQLSKPVRLLPTPVDRWPKHSMVAPAIHSRPLEPGSNQPLASTDSRSIESQTSGSSAVSVPAAPRRLPTPTNLVPLPELRRRVQPTERESEGATDAGAVQPAAYHLEVGIGTCHECGKKRRDCRCDAALGVLEFTDKVKTRVAQASHVAGQLPEVMAPHVAVAGYVPWWQPQITAAQRDNSEVLAVTLDEVILLALEHSHFIRAQSNLPLISEQAIMEAAAEFDVHAFTQSRFSRVSEPVGNALVTGPGRSRFRDRNWSHDAGIRKKTYSGGALELAQRYGYQRNNSDFLIPNPQSTTQLALRFSQPLLRGSGKFYNSSLIVLAELDKNIAWDQFSRELQDHLLEVAGAYWELYLQRAVLLQRERHFERAQEILGELETRGDIDAAESQIVRAQAAVASRQSDLARAYAAVRNAQVRLRALVNSPDLASEALELVPGEQPNPAFVDVGLQDAIVTALENRPEIDEAIQQLRSAKLQVSITQNELLPVLDVVTETYVSGLQGGSNIGSAWADQFRVGEPSYTVGIEMEVPLQNRAARARNKRKKLQLKWIVSRYKDTLETLVAEVEIVVRDVRTAYVEMSGKYHALQATQAELDYLTDRWQLLPGDDRSASFLLEDILDIQDRLVGHEFEFARAQVAYTQSLVELKRATGTLLRAEEVTLGRACECDIPQLHLSKPLQFDGDGSGSVVRPVETMVAPAYESVISQPIEMELLPPAVEELPRVEFPESERPAPDARLMLEPLQVPDPSS